jgi:LysR family glycine cleavage system transcriptional activator
MPRLPAFRERQPDIDVLISASDQLVNFNQEDFHMGIRYGWGQYPGMHTTQMMEDVIFPVCAPRLMEGAQPLGKPKDLSRYTLLHDDMARRDETSNDWATWLEHAGLSDIDPYKGPAFSHSSLALTAAIDGQGVALGRLTLVVDDLAAGRLVCPFGPIIEAPMKYYVVSPAPIAERPIVRQFREWLLEEAAKTPVRPVNLPDGFQTSLPPTS